MADPRLLAGGLPSFEIVLRAADLLLEVGLELFGALMLGQEPEHQPESFEPRGGRRRTAVFIFRLAILRRQLRWHSATGSMRPYGRAHPRKLVVPRPRIKPAESASPEPVGKKGRPRAPAVKGRSRTAPYRYVYHIGSPTGNAPSLCRHCIVRVTITSRTRSSPSLSPTSERVVPARRDRARGSNGIRPNPRAA